MSIETADDLEAVVHVAVRIAPGRVCVLRDRASAMSDAFLAWLCVEVPARVAGAL